MLTLDFIILLTFIVLLAVNLMMYYVSRHRNLDMDRSYITQISRQDEFGEEEFENKKKEGSKSCRKSSYGDDPSLSDESSSNDDVCEKNETTNKNNKDKNNETHKEANIIIDKFILHLKNLIKNYQTITNSTSEIYQEAFKICYKEILIFDNIINAIISESNKDNEELIRSTLPNNYEIKKSDRKRTQHSCNCDCKSKIICNLLSYIITINNCDDVSNAKKFKKILKEFESLQDSFLHYFYNKINLFEVPIICEKTNIEFERDNHNTNEFSDECDVTEDSSHANNSDNWNRLLDDDSLKTDTNNSDNTKDVLIEQLMKMLNTEIKSKSYNAKIELENKDATDKNFKKHIYVAIKKEDTQVNESKNHKDVYLSSEKSKDFVKNEIGIEILSRNEKLKLFFKLIEDKLVFDSYYMMLYKNHLKNTIKFINEYQHNFEIDELIEKAIDREFMPFVLRLLKEKPVRRITQEDKETMGYREHKNQLDNSNIYNPLNSSDMELHINWVDDTERLKALSKNFSEMKHEPDYGKDFKSEIGSDKSSNKLKKAKLEDNNQPKEKLQEKSGESKVSNEKIALEYNTRKRRDSPVMALCLE